MSAGAQLENANPVIFQRSGERLLTATDEDEDVHDPIDDREIFDILFVNDSESTVGIEFTPTIPHCSMATLIGLSIKIDVSITPGTHASEDAVNKQLADKERVAAALENSSLLEVVNQCLTTRSA
ncbi:Mitotic spindle-associated MMXD complex subunit MIP18 [Nibea albiflora]|uniref:Mitotic spindle-associated MMXD complex subunit MIP18 n=1 Tax=Nibea albiflora TaxID=240163 RepID=A0ACB7EHK7_NIBAL|nr:Mitotic spindle-associated MMXD complex subunit MIP18 [Nibea albiflora]